MTLIPPPPEYVPPPEPAHVYESDRQFLAELPGWDPSYEPIHYDSWSDYEEWGWYAILTKDGEYYEVSGGYSVMAEGSQEDRFEPWPTSYESAIQQMIDWEEMERPNPI